MKYKHKYEQALSIHPNGIACLQTHSWKNTPNIGHLSFTLSVAPVKHFEGKMVQSALKNKSDFSFLVKFLCCAQRRYWIMFSKAAPSIKHVCHSIKTRHSENSTQRWSRYLLSDGTALIWPKSLFDNKSVYFFKWKELPHKARLQTDWWPVCERSVHHYIKNDMSNMFSVKQKILK